LGLLIIACLQEFTSSVRGPSPVHRETAQVRGIPCVLLPRARIKESPEDFIVEEIPAYEPTGEGEHLFLRFTKRVLTTDDAVRAIAGALGVHARDVGVAGLKDKVGITTQTISVPIPRGQLTPFVDRALALSLPNITIVGAQPHGNKLKTGHLRGNRFAVRIRGLDPARVDETVAAFERVGREGLPNAFGPQRFGKAKDNAARAREWLSGRAPAPRDPRLRRLLWSALQAELFNALLDARVKDGTWATPLLGDLVKLRISGGLFLCADVQVDQDRAARGEVSPTGPIFGVKMRSPEGEPARLEAQILHDLLGENVDLAATKSLGEGTRRALRLWVEDMRVERSGGEQDDGIRVYFVLPKGAYATTVISSAVDWGTPPRSETNETNETAETEEAREAESE
jgi:tRNA pseudouridine13 synthase